MSSKRGQFVSSNFGQKSLVVTSDFDVLFVITDSNNLPQKKHMLIQAIMTVNDLFVTTRSTVNSLFTEDVGDFRESNNIRFSENIILGGKSGYNHHYPYLIPHFKNTPERVIHTMNVPAKGTLSNIIFSWSDTREARIKLSYKSNLYIFINDREKEVDKNIINALKNEDIHSVLWSNRDSMIDILSA